MISRVRELFSDGVSFEEVVARVGGLDELIKGIKEDEDYEFLSAEERQMVEDIIAALHGYGQQDEEEDEPDQEAYYDE